MDFNHKMPRGPKDGRSRLQNVRDILYVGDRRVVRASQRWIVDGEHDARCGLPNSALGVDIGVDDIVKNLANVMKESATGTYDACSQCGGFIKYRHACGVWIRFQ